MTKDLDGIWVPESLIEKAGAVLALNLSAFHCGFQQLSINYQLKAIQLNLLEEVYLPDEEIIKILKNKCPQDIFIDNSQIKKCLWCQCTSVCLHSHHHPISKARGGKKTVAICPNCHYEFHHLKEYPIFVLVNPYAREIDEYFQSQGGNS